MFYLLLDQCACGRFEDYSPLELDATEKIHRGFPWQVFRKYLERYDKYFKREPLQMLSATLL